MIIYRIKCGAIFMLLFISKVIFSQTDIIDFDTENWILGDNAKITQFAGRKALTGTAYLKDVEFLNGIAEVDIYSTGERNFGGFMFRIQSFDEYEWCWFRIHKSNGEIQDGLQYAPIFLGNSCWQLNGGKGGIQPVNLPKNQWVHLKIEILNDTAKFYVQDMTSPVMVMKNLQLGLKKGSVGIRANIPNTIYYSNFRYTIDKKSEIRTVQKNIPPEVITQWLLSPPYVVNDFAEIETYPDVKLNDFDKWITPDVEISGLVNINKYYLHKTGMPPSCAILKTVINSEENKIVKMNFGYSDAAAIFLNGQPLFWGNNAWRGRNMADGGWVDYNDAVFLNLKKGANEIIVALAEVFGGWGFQANINGESNIKNGFNRE